ncbi:uncharacterized protein LOC126979335 [Leptidea sinapis]|uniref:uncharacterized protein LOC126979335 n=1 Tax=Leptidea sinapis TaxID=189913 RepID=UPI0021C2B372|nr:uncharacterized protein LOC126979335 [Leptidea sinapis]
MKSLKNYPYWNSQRELIIISSANNIQEIFSFLRNVNYNYNIILLSISEKAEINVYRNDPFHNDNSGQTDLLKLLNETKVDIVIGGYYLKRSWANQYSFIWGHEYMRPILLGYQRIIWIRILIQFEKGLCSLTNHVREIYDMYVKPPDLKDLGTFTSEPCISDSIRDYFHSYGITLPANRSPGCGDTGSSLRAVANKIYMYTIEMDHRYKLSAHSFTSGDDYYKFYKHDLSKNLPLTFYVNRGFPLTKKFQKHVHFIFESGLLQHHMSILLNRFKRTRRNLKSHRLKLRDLKIIFALLFIGHFVAFLRFIFEVNRNRSL